MDYTIVRSRRKTLALEVSRELEVIVRSPMRIATREIEKFVEAHRDWISAAMNRQQSRAKAHPEPTDAEEKHLRELAKAIIPNRVEHFSALMGLIPIGVKITSARRRFGSCSPQNSLCFSWRLMQYPPEAVDYVVVHELAHILHKNHGAAFYRLIEEYMPDYKKRSAMLRN